MPEFGKRRAPADEQPKAMHEGESGVRFVPVPGPGTYLETLSGKMTEEILELIREDVGSEEDFMALLSSEIEVAEGVFQDDYTPAQTMGLLMFNVLSRLRHFDEGLWKEVYPDPEDDDPETEMMRVTDADLAHFRRSVERGVQILQALWQRLQESADTAEARAFMAEASLLFSGEPGQTPVEGLFYWLNNGHPRTTVEEGFPDEIRALLPESES